MKALQRWGIAGVLTSMLAGPPAHALDTMESVGAEKCGGPARSYEIEFLAPDSASLEATAKVVVKGSTVPRADAVTLAMDGKECGDARCAFQAKKGQAYRFSAASRVPSFDELCIVVARP
jgi:hypothetical protein